MPGDVLRIFHESSGQPNETGTIRVPILLIRHKEFK